LEIYLILNVSCLYRELKVLEGLLMFVIVEELFNKVVHILEEVPVWFRGRGALGSETFGTRGMDIVEHFIQKDLVG
jgi:hypothetical protein